MTTTSSLSLAFSKELEDVISAVALHIARVIFCRRHRTLRSPPAMAAELTTKLRNLKRLMN